ncbi:MAG: alkaline phosphatase family protein [Patescibacteria group bacterium]
MSTIYCIFDGFGLTENNPNNCIALANMPNFRNLMKTQTWTTLNADGIKVGQEEGLVGNSEVGHMNLGGLQLVAQLSYQITQSSTNNFELNKSISKDQILSPSQLLENTKQVHLVGLFSAGTIHSDMRHWVGAIRCAIKSEVKKIFLHLITDGRDSDRQSFIDTLNEFVSYFSREELSKIFVGSVGGRAYAMDRDNNFDKVFYGIQAMFGPELIEKTEVLRESFNIKEYKTANHINQSMALEDAVKKLQPYIESNYNKAIYDEFIEPIGFGGMDEEDPIWLINFRADRMRQIIKMVCDYTSDKKHRIIAMNDYGVGDIGYEFIFKSQPVVKNFAYFVELENKTQLHTAETEKYNHVTYFFNGGQDTKQPNETWNLIPSNKVTNHSEKPEMKAKEVADAVIDGLGKFDYIIVNFANPDMVGHCGDIQAGIKSMEFLDFQLGRILKALKLGNHNMILTSDHGNMEFVGPYKENGKDLTDTEHNPSPVPLIIVENNFSLENLLKKIESISKKYGLECDIELIKESLSPKNVLEGGWLKKSEIPEAKLPLWYAGLIAFAINNSGY